MFSFNEMQFEFSNYKLNTKRIMSIELYSPHQSAVKSQRVEKLPRASERAIFGAHSPQLKPIRSHARSVRLSAWLRCWLAVVARVSNLSGFQSCVDHATVQYVNADIEDNDAVN